MTPDKRTVSWAELLGVVVSFPGEGRPRECSCCLVSENPLSGPGGTARQAPPHRASWKFLGVAFGGGLSRLQVGVAALSTQQSENFWKTQLEKYQGSWCSRPGVRGRVHLPSLVLQPSPTQAVPPLPRLHPVILPTPHQVPAPESHLPCMCPELSGFSWAACWSWSSSCFAEALIVCCLWCYHCAHGAWPPSHAQNSHRTACANTSGRRLGPGWGDASGF